MALSDLKVAFIGGGSMAEALIRGLLKADAINRERIIASTRRQQRADTLSSAYGITVTLDNRTAASNADVVVLAVKPQIMDRILGEISGCIGPDALVVSIAAGVTIATIKNKLTGAPRIWRAMPNLPAVVDAAAVAIAAERDLGLRDERDERDLTRVTAIFSAVGEVVEMDENLINAATGLSGSGPAFVFMIIEALSDAGVKVGLSRRQAQTLAAHTVLGSAKMLIETGEHPGVLKDRVTSPGGTAIAGLHTLEEGGLRTTLINAVTSATARCAELANGD